MHAEQITYHTQVAATHTTDQVTITYTTEAIECCETRVRWGGEEGTQPHVWDTSGLGEWDLATRRQCGTCGAIIEPAEWTILVDASDQELAAELERVSGLGAERLSGAVSDTQAKLDAAATAAAEQLAGVDLGDDDAIDDALGWGQWCRDAGNDDAAWKIEVGDGSVSVWAWDPSSIGDDCADVVWSERTIEQC